MPNAPYEMLVLSDEWFGLPTSCRHILQHFLPDVRLIWAQTIGLRAPGLSLYDLRRVFQVLGNWTAPKGYPEPLPANLTIISPFQVPLNQWPIVRAFNRRSIIRSLRHDLGPREGRERVLLTTWPFLAHLVGHLGDTVSVYYRVDDFSEFPGVKKDYILEAERDLMGRVDLIAASARNLMPQHGAGATAVYLPHGVDYDHFASADAVPPVNSPLTAVAKPRIGFFGLLSEWVDLELISNLARKRTDWSFVIIGPSQLPIGDLPRLPNIHFLGPIPYRELPGHARLFDVGIIPFRINKLTRSVNPLKLFEYFALGLPVVSTPLPEVAGHPGLLSVADGAEQFEKAISKALSEDSAELRERRKRYAEANSWASRAADLRKHIEEILSMKTRPG